jgi:hypothetical protein
MTTVPFTDDEHHFPGLRLPIGDKAGQPCKKADLEALARNNESGASGYYPIGLYQTWHNGIHLWAGEGSPVHAVCDGRIVAACVGRKTEISETFGCRGFVLVRHTITTVDKPLEKDRLKRGKLTNVTFFALYQHLLGLGRGGIFPGWLESMRLFLASEANPDDGKFVRVFGKPGGKKNTHQAIELRSEPTKQKSHKKGSEHWVRGDRVLGKLEEATVVQLIGEPRESFQQVRVMASTRLEGWLAVDGATTAELPELGTQIKDLRNGGTVALDIPVSAGEVLGFAGPVEGEHPDVAHPHASSGGGCGLHLEIFSADRLIPAAEKGWQLLEDDTDADVMAELGPAAGKITDPEVADVLKKLAFDTSPRDLGTPGARRAYFQGLPAPTKQKLRTIITKNASYWAIDWTKVEGQSAAWLKRYEISEAEKTDANRYSWWRLLVGKAAAMKLPASPVAFHYHPLGFLGYLLDHQLEPPIFYTRIAGKIRVVERVGHEYTWVAGQHVWVHDPGDDPADPQSDWELGHSSKYKSDNPAKGLDWTGAPDLYDFLLVGGDDYPAAPNVEDDKKRIWAAIHAVEGGLDSINCYDTAFLSFGPIQQTAGTATHNGELGGALAAVKENAPEIYAQLLSDRGLDVTDPGRRTDRAPVNAYLITNGQTTDNLAAKERLREFYWNYLLRVAMRDEAFVSAFMEHGLTRLDTIRNFTGDFGGRKLRMGDVILSELGQALILDAHVNLPLVAMSWKTAVVRVLGLNFKVEDITAEDEKKVVMRFIYERLISKLNDPFLRTSKVLACTKDCEGDYDKELEAYLKECQVNAGPEAQAALKATQDARTEAEERLAKAKTAQNEAAEAVKKTPTPQTKAAMAAATNALKKVSNEADSLKKQEAKAKQLSDKRTAEAAGLPLWPRLKKDLDQARKSLAHKNRTPFVIRDRGEA